MQDKRKVLALLFACVFLNVGLLWAQPKLVWQKCIGGTRTESGQFLDITSDGGVIITGVTQSNDVDFAGKRDVSSDVFLAKLDATGNLQWTKTYGSSLGENAFKVRQTKDGGYIVLGVASVTATTPVKGEVEGESKGRQDIWVFKTDANGTIQWQKLIGGSANDYAEDGDIRQTKDNGYVIVGNTQSNDFDFNGDSYGGQDACMIKLSENGTIQFTKKFGGSKVDVFRGVQELEDGSFFIIGETSSEDFTLLNPAKPFNGGVDLWVIKTDAQGNRLWQKLYGGTLFDGAYSIAKNSDGTFIICGTSYSSNGDLQGVGQHGGNDTWLIKMDVEGNIIWNKLFGGTGSEMGVAAAETPDGGFMAFSFLMGYTVGNTNGDITEFKGGYSDFWIIKTDKNGTLEWTRTVGGSGLEVPQYVGSSLVDKDGNFLLVGGTNSKDGDVTGYKGGSGYDAWVAKFAPCENLITKPVITQNTNILSVDNNYTAYQWLFNNEILNGGTANNHIAINTGWYTVAVENSYGCTDTAEAFQFFAKPNLFVPNVFTPNGDGKNDVLKVYANQLASVEFIIFDQWGKKVFETRDPNQTWNGSTGGKQQPVGVYIYSLKATFLDGTAETKKGSINLIR